MANCSKIWGKTQLQIGCMGLKELWQSQIKHIQTRWWAKLLFRRQKTTTTNSEKIRVIYIKSQFDFIQVLILSVDCRSSRIPLCFQEILAISLTVAFCMRCRCMMHLREISELGLKNLAGGRLGNKFWSVSSGKISNIESEGKNNHFCSLITTKMITSHLEQSVLCGAP